MSAYNLTVNKIEGYMENSDDKCAGYVLLTTTLNDGDS